MSIAKEQEISIEDNDSIDSYFDCITSCGIGDEANECLTNCLEIHLKSNIT